MTTTKYCKDCIHFEESTLYEKSRCFHDAAVIKIEPIYGKVLYQQAEEMRQNTKLCGTGKYYTPMTTVAQRIKLWFCQGAK